MFMLTSYYVPWDISLFLKGVDLIRTNMGSALNIAFWIFMIMTGVFFVVKIVSSIGQ